MRDELFYRLVLYFLKGIKLAAVKELLTFAQGSCTDLFTQMSYKEWPLPDKIKSKITASAIDEAYSTAETEWQFIEKKGIKAHFFSDQTYPHRLRECEDAPVMLFSKGNALLNKPKVISIVGTRHATPYGREFCETFIQDLSSALPEILIVSGLAYGIDIAAHKAALDAGVPTVAVLAHGLNMIYPASHRNTAASMIDRGALLTEYSSQHRLHKMNFVSRNRIVAGMADAVIVVESAEKGGALITADLAGGYNRDVFALPGRVIDPYSQGCNRLISANRAALITSAYDFVSQMCWESKSGKSEATQLVLFDDSDLSPDEKPIVDFINRNGECHINQLVAELALSTGQLLPLLLELEFKNRIQPLPGGVYRRC